MLFLCLTWSKTPPFSMLKYLFLWALCEATPKCPCPVWELSSACIAYPWQCFLKRCQISCWRWTWMLELHQVHSELSLVHALNQQSNLYHGAPVLTIFSVCALPIWRVVKAGHCDSVQSLKERNRTGWKGCRVNKGPLSNREFIYQNFDTIWGVPTEWTYG